jgi:hypothetical protein
MNWSCKTRTDSTADFYNRGFKLLRPPNAERQAVIRRTCRAGRSALSTDVAAQRVQPARPARVTIVDDPASAANTWKITSMTPSSRTMVPRDQQIKLTVVHDDNAPS